MAKSRHFRTKNAITKNYFKVMIKKSNIHAPELLNLFNSLRKSDKILSKPCILSLFPQLV